MEMFENFRWQNSGYPLQGVVLDGLGRAIVVADVEPFVRTVEVGNPAMAVRSSVVEEGNVEDEGVAVAFCTPEMIVAATLPDRVGMLMGIRLLG
jgi:hypothetical protein